MAASRRRSWRRRSVIASEPPIVVPANRQRAGTYTPRRRKRVAVDAFFHDKRPALCGTRFRRDDPSPQARREEKKKGRIIDPAFCYRFASKSHAAFSRPSSVSASCTFGRAATRALYAIRFCNPERSSFIAVGPAQHREQIAVGDGELLAHQVVVAGQRASTYLNLPMIRSLKNFFTSSGIVGLNSGLKFLCSSAVMKLSHSCSL